MVINNIKKYIPQLLKNFIRKYIIPSPLMSNLSLAERGVKLKNFYALKMGKTLDLENPVLFTEKLQWMKLYYKNDSMSKCVDKYDFKNYVHEKIGDGYTAKLIKVWNNPSEVSIKDIPEKKFVIKSTLQSDGIFILPIDDKERIDIKKIEEEIKSKWFDPRNLLINSFCSAYYSCKPRVIVEEFIEEFANAANDYKLFCFNGEPFCCYVAEDHFKNGENCFVYPITFFDLNWNVMDVKYGNHTINPSVPKPYHFEKMMELAKILSKDFPFVRVDFFDTKEKLYLAELTFYPGGGVTPYHPEAFNKELGDRLNIEILKEGIKL